MSCPKSKSYDNGDEYFEDDGRFMGWNHTDDNDDEETNYDDNRNDYDNGDDGTGTAMIKTRGPATNYATNYIDNGEDNSSSNDHDNDDDDDDDDEEEDRWSLNIRINSAIDLPSSILPSIPLCPFMKFGLITVTDENEILDLEKSSAEFRRKTLWEQSHTNTAAATTTATTNSNTSTSSTPTPSTPSSKSSSLANTKLQKQESLRIFNFSGHQNNGSLTKFQNNVPLEQCILPTTNTTNTTTSPSSPYCTTIIHSSYKIMSKKDNGMMEWSEEIRFDNIELPLQTVLCIELSAKAVFPFSSSSSSTLTSKSTLSLSSYGNNGYGTGAGMGGGGGGTPFINTIDYSHHYISNTTNNRHHDLLFHGDGDGTGNDKNDNNGGSGSRNGTNSAPSSGNGGGFLGFWRKGRGGGAGSKNTTTITHNGKRSNNTGSIASSYHGSDEGGGGALGGFSEEMEKATAAAAVARYLMENSHNENVNVVNNEGGVVNHYSEKSKNIDDYVNESCNGDDDNDDRNEEKQQEKSLVHDEDIRLGTLLIPISNLPLEQEVPTVEKWFQFVSVAQSNKQLYDDKLSPSSKVPSLRSPSVLLQISLSNPEILDELEEEAYSYLDGDGTANEDSALSEDMRLSLTPADQKMRQTMIQREVDKLKKEDDKAMEEEMLKLKIEESGPYLEPGIIDHICVVGPDQNTFPNSIDGGRGWLEDDVESCVLEQFPPEGYHVSHGRNTALPEKVEWWCFPEGCRLWKGKEPPTHMDMNLKRFSASSPSTMASSIAAFDACLDCTSSFMWWVLCSYNDEYGFKAQKTYGACIRFYVPVSAMSFNDDASTEEHDCTFEGERLWSPMGICITSRLPIIGTMEAVLLRLCEKLSASASQAFFNEKITHRDVMNLILNYQSPIPGVINCSIPFLSGDADRLLVTLPPPYGLPPLPHGASLTSVCRLLGAEGLTALLASVLTECKVIIHSADLGNLSMVAEVITALIYPFKFQHTYIPVIPKALMEVIEAPGSNIFGVPTCNMKCVDKEALLDAVVIDLDNSFSTPDYFDSRQSASSSRIIVPLPASVNSNISKAVFQLLREEEKIQEQFGASNFSDTRHLPRLDSETLAERDFRICVAQQICSLIRGYQECLFFVSANQPVFNRDRFLRQAPALFEERTSSPDRSQRILSPRSKRFLSGLVNTQHFLDLLERLDNEDSSFFHHVMDSFQTNNNSQSEGSTQAHTFGSPKQIETVLELSKVLDDMEQNLPIYHVHASCDKGDDVHLLNSDAYMTSFTSMLFTNVVAQQTNDGLNGQRNQAPKLSLKELIELKKKQSWKYYKLFDIALTTSDVEKSDDLLWSKIQLKEAIGERKFRSWKSELKKKEFSPDDLVRGQRHGSNINSQRAALDLMQFIPTAYEESGVTSKFSTRGKRFNDERDVVRRYIENVNDLIQTTHNTSSHTSELRYDEFFASNKIEIERALCNPLAQRFLVSMLSQRARLKINDRRQSDQSYDDNVSRLQPIMFECIVNLCNAMLDACAKESDYESAYQLLTHTTGFSTFIAGTVNEENEEMSFLTKRVGMHAIYSDLRLWERVVLLHKRNSQRESGRETVEPTEAAENDEYEASVSTLYEMLSYGMAVNDLAKFASRIATEKFFSKDKAQKIMILARKLALKCDETDAARDAMLLRKVTSVDEISMGEAKETNDIESEVIWEQVSWSHNTSLAIHGDLSSSQICQSPITAITSFGSSVVVSGALDGSIFLAHTFKMGSHNPKERNGINGVNLEIHDQNFSPSASRTDEVGAISCLAVSKGSHNSTRPNAFALDHDVDNEAILSAVAGCHVIGGTTGGLIRVWSLHDIFTHELVQDSEDLSILTDSQATIQSSHIRSRLSHLESAPAKASRQGRAIGSHRGGVTCLSVPAQIYRPDALISGGNDGLIKQWSLEPKPSSTQFQRSSMGGRTSRMLFARDNAYKKRIGQEEVNVLTGHGGRILCLETAWHCDRLLSGAADLTVKLWDLASGSNQCIQTMTGHSGWVTDVRFWGRNTAISASTDRSIALWDVRSGSMPMFALRLHQSPVSDLYIQSRNSFWMTSAGADGVVATWDIRKLSSLNRKDNVVMSQNNFTHVVRHPTAIMTHYQSIGTGIKFSGPIQLSGGVNTKYGQGDRTVMSVGNDGLIKEWDAMSGKLVSTHDSKHTNKISCFTTFRDTENLMNGQQGKRIDQFCLLGGTITAAWDGKIKLRKMLFNRRHQH